MKTEIDPEIFRKSCLEMEYVGSRVTCSPPPTDTDRDVLCLVASHSDFRELAFIFGFVLCGSHVLDAALPLDSDDRFSSYLKEEVNLIVTEDPVFFNKFMAATSVAKRLNLLDKNDRIALFQAVLYGNRSQ